jgi:putative ABC transport system ATP-binding protein
MSECTAAGSAIVFVSHDRSLAGQFDRQVSLPELNRLASGPAA